MGQVIAFPSRLKPTGTLDDRRRLALLRDAACVAVGSGLTAEAAATALRHLATALELSARAG
jgi:hypothetical protein